MIIKFNESKTKIVNVESNSLFPNTDYLNEGNYVMDETTEEGKQLANKINVNYPYFDIVLDENGELTDITLTERPAEPTPTPTLEDRLSAMEGVIMMLMMPPI